MSIFDWKSSGWGETRRPSIEEVELKGIDYVRKKNWAAMKAELELYRRKGWRREEAALMRGARMAKVYEGRDPSKKRKPSYGTCSAAAARKGMDRKTDYAKGKGWGWLGNKRVYFEKRDARTWEYMT